jgi:hypothetical protein
MHLNQNWRQIIFNYPTYMNTHILLVKIKEKYYLFTKKQCYRELLWLVHTTKWETIKSKGSLYLDLYIFATMQHRWWKLHK